MALIKNGAVIADPWVFLGDDDALEVSHPVVSLARWQAEGDELRARTGPLGIRLASGEQPEGVLDDLDRFDLIALDFPRFTDGRSYSTARLLRERHGYTGELRAFGNVLRDQAVFMLRCGFDSFELAEPTDVSGWLAALDEIDVFFQPAADGKESIMARRQAGRTVPSGGGNGGNGVDNTHRRSRAAFMADRYAGLGAAGLLRRMITREFPGRITLVSSFGAESAVLLHLVASIDRTLPVTFIDTGKMFDETLRYRDALTASLGLRDVRSITPDSAVVALNDPDGLLWSRAPDDCCAIRKVAPLVSALEGFDAWITGRKRFHGAERAALDRVEAAEGRIKVNPLADWSEQQVQGYMTVHDLPAHPLVEAGYPSIGCATCTHRVDLDSAMRDGRWRGFDKTECGIHGRLMSDLAAKSLESAEL